MPTSKGLFASVPSHRILSSQGSARLLLLCLFAAALTSILSTGLRRDHGWPKLPDLLSIEVDFWELCCDVSLCCHRWILRSHMDHMIGLRHPLTVLASRLP
ncbi:hypothetical protein ABIE13_003996 [Ottowia thiooxydans]|uniref:Uncharacterized protein n=1 Tax=Ottowia thiooxydans TaxID=219182 RepID=A0ABV2QCW4_9BURK